MQNKPKKKTASRSKSPSFGGIAGAIEPKTIVIAAAAVVVLVLAFCFQYLWFPGGVNVFASQRQTVEVQPVGAIRVNEVMTSNKKAYSDDMGNYPDWIELTNTSNGTVDLTGWVLTDGPDRPLGFTFPQTVIGPGEMIVVYASKELKSVAGFAYHAPFKLSASGDAVMLYDSRGNIMESINVPALSANQVYMRDSESGEWAVSSYYTPGMENTYENHLSLVNAGSNVVGYSDLIVTEFMADNKSYIADEDGEYHDWIEIHNRGDSAINLEGYGLSDDFGKLGRWRFPAVTIGPGEYLIVYASGKDRRGTDGSNLHADFKLSAEGESVLLTDNSNNVLDRIQFENMKSDRSLSRTDDDNWSSTMPPTPGQPNTSQGAAIIDGQLRAQNPSGIYINEAMASARQAEATSSVEDWLEIYNSSPDTVNLSGYGLSDDPSHPRKWQFPEGAKIGAGQYVKVVLSGADTGSVEKMQLQTNFSLSLTDGEVLTLCTPEGTIIDRMPLTQQYAGISCGRVPGKDGFFYFEKGTPEAVNNQTAYAGRTADVRILAQGGWFEGGAVTVELKADENALIFYTTDCTEPTASSSLYTEPIEISSTTILRVRAYENDKLASEVGTRSYLFGEKHTLPIVSLVAEPDDLFSNEKGIYAKGPNATGGWPYGSKNKGANFWMDWERGAHIEIYETDGSVLLSQGAGIAMHGAYSRALSQKAFAVNARSVYGGNRFNAPLFPDRDYTEYKSFTLRGSGQDGALTRMRDSILAELVFDEGILCQDTRVVILYLNGEYWGHYNIRERINKYSIAQFEGWTDVDSIDLIKANSTVLQGSNGDYADFLNWLKKNGCASEENLARVAQVVDIENYLTYIAIEMYVGNGDTLNVKRYRSNTEGDGRWKWILFDLDWAAYNDTDSYRRWLNPKGMGVNNWTDNTLFIELMKNRDMKLKFYEILNRLMLTNFDPTHVLEIIDERYALLLPEMPMHMDRWEATQSIWKDHVGKFRKWMTSRPSKLLRYIKDFEGYSTDQMREYFGEVMAREGI